MPWMSTGRQGRIPLRRARAAQPGSRGAMPAQGLAVGRRPRRESQRTGRGARRARLGTGGRHLAQRAAHDPQRGRRDALAVRCLRLRERYPERDFTLGGEDVLVAVTDGITDPLATGSDQLGLAALARVLAGAPVGPAGICASLMSATRRFGGGDDATVLAVALPLHQRAASVLEALSLSSYDRRRRPAMRRPSAVPCSFATNGASGRHLGDAGHLPVRQWNSPPRHGGACRSPPAWP